MKPRWFLEGFGVALLILLPYFFDLLLPGNISLYHHLLPVKNLVGGVLIDLVFSSILVTLFIGIGTRVPPNVRKFLGACFAGIIIFRVLDDAVVIAGLLPSLQSSGSGILSQTVVRWSEVRRSVAIGAIGIPGLLVWIYPRFAQLFVRATRTAIAAVAFSALWIVPQLLHLAFMPQAHESTNFAKTTSGAPTHNGRVVWILFDELSSALVFEHPVLGEQYSNFKKLRSQSVFFSNVRPIGFLTDHIIPALIAGHPITEIRSTADGTLLYKDQKYGKWTSYDISQSLFGQAQINHWSPGVAGWYNPYCRTFASALTSCSWQPAMLGIEALGASEDNSPLANAVAINRAFVGKLGGDTNATRNLLLDRNIQDYRDIMKNAQSLIRNGDLRFIFLHIPVPHPPGMYDRDTHTLRRSGTYLDNLTLADDTLGVLMSEINSTPWANDTTILVTSDHSWRIPIWRSSKEWAKEEAEFSGGQFDDRPVLLIHFPGQTFNSRVSAQTPELVEHDIIQKMLWKQVTTPEQLTDFITEHGSENLPAEDRVRGSDIGQ